jgi:hypothetical protein
MNFDPKYIKIKNGKYKFALTERCGIYTGIHCYHIETEYFTLSKNGYLEIRPGYQWDGASGPVINTDPIIKASLPHDVLYQLMRQGKLPLKHRKRADELFRDILRYECSEGCQQWHCRTVCRTRAHYCYLAVRSCGWVPARWEV